MATSPSNVSSTSSTLIDRLHSEDGVGARLAVITREDYARKVKTMQRHIAADGGALTPSTLARFLQTSFETRRYAQSTGRSLKAAALHWLTSQAEPLHAQDGDISDHAHAFDHIVSLDTNSLPLRSEATSGTKLKFFSKKALDDLTEYTQKSTRSKIAGTLLAFVRANLLVGLRPVEWFQASLFSYLTRLGPSPGDYEATLGMNVVNAKQTHGRANGASRTLLLESISEDDAATIRHFLEIVRNHVAKYPEGTPIADISREFYGSLQRAMSDALRQMGHASGSRPTVYSTRHQAVANAKSSGLSDREVAAFFGHVSVSTAKKHYGKKMNGWSKTTFRPSAESVAAVKVKEMANNAAPSQRIRDEMGSWLSAYRDHS